MSTNRKISAFTLAMAAAVALSSPMGAKAADVAKEKCYGIAKA